MCWVGVGSTTTVRFELTRAQHKGLAVLHLNHSVTWSCVGLGFGWVGAGAGAEARARVCVGRGGTVCVHAARTNATSHLDALTDPHPWTAWERREAVRRAGGGGVGVCGAVGTLVVACECLRGKGGQGRAAEGRKG